MKVKNLITITLLFFVLPTMAQVSFTYTGKMCIGSDLQFINQSSNLVTGLLWDFGNGDTSTETNPVHSYSSIGTYKVQLSGTMDGNTYSKSQNIVIGPNPIAAFTDSVLYFSSYTRIFTNTSTSGTGALHYTWSFGDGQDLATDSIEIAHKYAAAGTYVVKLVTFDSKTCTDSFESSVVVEDLFKVPNVFTPNGDNLNDQFVVTSNGETRFSIDIYSRWGVLVCQREGQQQIVWDGRMPDGTLVNPGTYYYVITTTDNIVKYEPEQGFITIFY